MDNNEKFKVLCEFLKTVPSVEATEEEKKLMELVDNDPEEQKRTNKIINERREINGSR